MIGRWRRCIVIGSSHQWICHSKMNCQFKPLSFFLPFATSIEWQGRHIYASPSCLGKQEDNASELAEETGHETVEWRDEECWRFRRSTADLCPTFIVYDLYVAMPLQRAWELHSNWGGMDIYQWKWPLQCLRMLQRTPHITSTIIDLFFIASYAHIHYCLGNNNHLRLNSKLNSKLNLRFRYQRSGATKWQWRVIKIEFGKSITSQLCS